MIMEQWMMAITIALSLADIAEEHYKKENRRAGLIEVVARTFSNLVLAFITLYGLDYVKEQIDWKLKVLIASFVGVELRESIEYVVKKRIREWNK